MNIMSNQKNSAEVTTWLFGESHKDSFHGMIGQKFWVKTNLFYYPSLAKPVAIVRVERRNNKDKPTTHPM